ncbi:hypothetical protein ALP50_05789 [Pseudomonas syringae pv. spinaceae]|nr:hypothetical protein ALP50_05789 [Pseudomonas syringae pv. spinaceae]
MLHGVLQQAQFVLTGRAGVLSQVTVGDPARGDDCIVQRNGDLASDQQRSKDTDQQHHQRNTQQLHHSCVLFLFGADNLLGRQIIGDGRCCDGLLLQVAANLIGLLEHFRDRRHQHLVLLQGIERGVYGGVGFDGQLAASRCHLGNQRIGRGVGRQPVIGGRHAQVAAEHQTKVGHAVTQVASDLHLLDAGFVRCTQRIVDGLLQQVLEGRADLVGHLDDRLERVIDLLIDTDQLIERLLEAGHPLLDVAQSGQVARYDEHLQPLIDTAAQGVQRAAVGLHTGSARPRGVCLSGNTGVQDVSLDLGDLATLAQTLDQQVGAGVTDSGDGQHAQQNSGEAQPELLADVQVIQPFCAHYVCAFDFPECP